MKNENIQIRHVVGHSLNLVFPLTMVYMCYIILHGHLSPGGGFQGGVLIVGVFLMIYFANGYQATAKAISFNLLRNHYRHDEIRKQYELSVSKQHDVAADAHIIEQIDNRAFDIALQRELEKLQPEGRLLFSLRFEEELTVPQIAEVMAVPEGTVKSRLHALTQTLKQKLNPT